LNESFEFVVNGRVIESEVSETAALFPRIREQLSVDGCARKFFIHDSRIESTDLRSLELVLSGEMKSEEGCQGCLIGFLGNEIFDRLFLNFSKSTEEKNLFELKKKSRINFESMDVSVLSIESLDSLLLNESISVESEDALLRHILKLGEGYRDLLRHIQVEFLSEDGLSLLSESVDIPPESVWEIVVDRITHPTFPDLRIMSDIPKIFAEFRGKLFSLLWRGSRDGFSASKFHGRCDGQANTLTLIFDTNGNIFGGFTPLQWESLVWNRKAGNENNTFKTDENQKSFVFTLKNPHNFPARKFALKADKKDRAIICDSEFGPFFPGGFCVSDNCNTNIESRAGMFGLCYTNDTGLDRETFLAGSRSFQVKEIEVFEITA
jgi:hypothetical protein